VASDGSTPDHGRPVRSDAPGAVDARGADPGIRVARVDGQERGEGDSSEHQQTPGVYAGHLLLRLRL
jgi:hypothetical protein